MKTEKAKVSRNKSDKTVVAERNYGLKGGETSAAKPNNAAINAEFKWNFLINPLAETPKQNT
jgi:hypothetical protein